MHANSRSLQNENVRFEMSAFSQYRNVRFHAALQDLDVARISVGCSDPPDLIRMMEAAVTVPRAFDVVLVDDSSRLSRSLSDAMQIFERLNFAGVRVIAVSQGIDSQNEQADVLVTVHGLMDSLYVKELAKKTHRG
jgi:DNA invertase Pin-like site-specific DNA recombinase